MYKVLVVEDEPLLLSNICGKIEAADLNFEVVGRALNGEQALELLDDLRPDVLFTDVRMPQMDGLELIRRSRERIPELIIIVLSGYSDFENAQRAMHFGVREYLLKPLSAEALQDVLIDCKSELDQRLARDTQMLLLGSIQDNLSDYDSGHSMESMRFSLILMSLNNVAGPQQRAFSNPRNEECWQSIDWKRICHQISSPWWVARNRNACFATLVIADERTDANISQVAEGIWVGTREALPDTVVTIVPSDEPCTYQQLPQMAARLRTAIDHGAVLGISQMLLLRAIESAYIPPAMLNSSEAKRVESYLNHEDIHALRNELFSLLEDWSSSKMPLFWVKRLLHKLFNIFQQYNPHISELEIMSKERELAELMLYADRLTSIKEEIWALLASALPAGAQERVDASMLANQIEAYMNAHYADEISMADLGRQFSLNPAYMTRVFRRDKGVSPIRYIIRLRIEKAKRLLRDCPDMDIRRISELVGYQDSFYFSRIFKQVIGMTPTEYRTYEK